MRINYIHEMLSFCQCSMYRTILYNIIILIYNLLILLITISFYSAGCWFRLEIVGWIIIFNSFSTEILRFSSDFRIFRMMFLKKKKKMTNWKICYFTRLDVKLEFKLPTKPLSGCFRSEFAFNWNFSFLSSGSRFFQLEHCSNNIFKKRWIE